MWQSASVRSSLDRGVSAGELVCGLLGVVIVELTQCLRLLQIRLGLEQPLLLDESLKVEGGLSSPDVPLCCTNCVPAPKLQSHLLLLASDQWGRLSLRICLEPSTRRHTSLEFFLCYVVLLLLLLQASQPGLFSKQPLMVWEAKTPCEKVSTSLPTCVA